MTARDAARAIAAGRLAIGAGLIAAPAQAGRAWIGEDAGRPGAQVLCRALGARDLILGALTLHVVDRPGVGYRTVATCAIADAVDCAATLAVREKLPAPAAIGAMALAGGCTVVGLAAAAGLRN
jgi:hypothetical protein